MRRLIWIFVVALMIVDLGRPVYALPAIDTQPTIELPVAPLIITAYQAHLAPATFDTKGKVLTQWLDDIDILELYNSGDTLIRLADWHIVDVADAARELSFSSAYDGYVEPGSHVVLSRLDLVTHATYAIEGWNNVASGDRVTPGLLLVNDAYRSSQTDLKVSDILEKRSFGVSGYLSTFVDAVSYETPNVDAVLTDRLFDDGLYAPQNHVHGLAVVEIYPYASDCAPFDASALCGDYVKLSNTSDHVTLLDGLVLRSDSSSSSRTSSNTFHLAGALQPGSYVTIQHTDDGSRLSLTNSGGYVWIEDMWGLVHYDDTVAQYESAGTSQQGYGYARDATSTWQWTVTPQPFGDNLITEPTVTCTAGKYLNPDTGRCRTLEEAVNALAGCDEGYERNPTTNRCRKITSTATTTLVSCGEGQERNPTTNRCRSIASAVAELLPCDEGYERNPSTNRCRKIAVSDMPQASFPVEPFSATPQTIIGWWIGGVIGAVVVGYGAWEWRHEIMSVGRRILRRHE